MFVFYSSDVDVDAAYDFPLGLVCDFPSLPHHWCFLWSLILQKGRERERGEKRTIKLVLEPNRTNQNEHMIIGSFSTLLKLIRIVRFAVLCHSARLASKEIVFLSICNDVCCCCCCFCFFFAVLPSSILRAILCSSQMHRHTHTQNSVQISFTHIAIPICLRAIIIRMTNSIRFIFSILALALIF